METSIKEKMKIIKTEPQEKTELRRQAEDRLNANKSSTSLSDSGADPQKLLQELQIHQIELEMQNEQLRKVQAELEASQKKRFDLYDLAPVGYLTLSAEGLILEANLKSSTLLDISRNNLAKQPLIRFILREDQNVYNQAYKRLFETQTPQECEVRMLRNESQFWAQIQANIGEDTGDSILSRVVLSDITERKQAEEALRESEERCTVPWQ